MSAKKNKHIQLIGISPLGQPCEVQRFKVLKKIEITKLMQFNSEILILHLPHRQNLIQDTGEKYFLLNSVPLIPHSCLFFRNFHPSMLFYCKILQKVSPCIIFPFFSQFPDHGESHLLPSILLHPIQFGTPPPSWDSCPPPTKGNKTMKNTQIVITLYLWFQS